MNISKFSIENYRSLKDLKIDGFATTTIFYGDNNAGKSNVLNAMQLIFSRKPKLTSEGLTDFENFYQGILRDSQNSYFNNNTSQPIKFSVDVELSKSELAIDEAIKLLFKTGNKFTFTFEGSITFIGQENHDYSEFKIETIKLGAVVIYLNTTDISFFPSLDKTQKKQGELERAFSHLIDIFNDCVHVVSSDRDMHETPMVSEENFKLDPKTFKKFLYSLYLSPRQFNLFEQINTVYSQAPFNFGTISFSNDNGKLEIMIQEKDFRLPIKHLGSGALQALYIITSIICSKSKIVCLEELEQNLSPKKQYETLIKIQAMITDPKLSLNQLLISSHSSVYAKPKLGTIYFLEKLAGQTSINKKETTKICKKLQGHLADSQGEWNPADMVGIKKRLKEKHDFV